MRSFSARIFGSLCLLSVAATAAGAACYAPDQQMSPQAVSDFLNNPASLLSNPDSGSLGNVVRDLVASNPSTLPVVIGLLKSANDAQQKAIGTGLGLAANICSRPDPIFASDISDLLNKSSSELAKTNYAAIVGKATGSVGGGGAGGAVSAGGVGGSTTPVAGFTGGSSGVQPFTSGGAFNTGVNFFGSSVGGASVAPNTTPSTTSTTASNSVSK
jgi:hypothetical protein